MHSFLARLLNVAFESASLRNHHACVCRLSRKGRLRKERSGVFEYFFPYFPFFIPNESGLTTLLPLFFGILCEILFQLSVIHIKHFRSEILNFFVFTCPLYLLSRTHSPPTPQFCPVSVAGARRCREGTDPPRRGAAAGTVARSCSGGIGWGRLQRFFVY